MGLAYQMDDYRTYRWRIPGLFRSNPLAMEKSSYKPTPSQKLNVRVHYDIYRDRFESVKLTCENVYDMLEWAGSKLCYSPTSDGVVGSPVIGLTVFTPTGKVQAEFGDYIIQGDGQAFVVKAFAYEKKYGAK